MCKRMTIAAVAAVVLACVSGVQAQVVIETVTVGNQIKKMFLSVHPKN